MPSISRRFATVIWMALAGCSAATATRAGAADSPFAATWVQREPAAGTSFVLTLRVSADEVTGTGTYTIESGQRGSVIATGAVHGERLLLALSYGDQQAAQFDGELASASELRGALHLGPRQALTPSAIVSFDRKR